MIGNGDWKQVWTLKVILIGFEAISGLEVNYNKSRLIGYNLNQHFLYATANFLRCRIQVKEFDFLGFRLGDNHQTFSWWEPLLKKLKDRLGSWKSKIL